MPKTQSLFVYAYPEEVNYKEIREQGWFNLEVFDKSKPNVRSFDQLVPPEFLADTLNNKFSGKYVYLSLGSMGSIDVNLMKRLVNILSGTPHKYIVSKGPCHDQFALATNMWGHSYLPQVALLPFMDLVITHGGNNTFTETFAQGKPMIILPLFADQHDNGQRVHETGYGVRLHPYDFEDHELVEAVDKLLNDHVLHTKLANVVQRMEGLNRFEELAVLLEERFAK